MDTRMDPEPAVEPPRMDGWNLDLWTVATTNLDTNTRTQSACSFTGLGHCPKQGRTGVIPGQQLRAVIP